MSNVVDGEMSVKQAVALLTRVRRRHVMRLAVVRSLWLGLAVLALCFYADGTVHLSGWVRLWLDIVGVGTVLAAAILTYWWLNRSAARNKMLARLIECDHPELGNDLTNAIDFEERLDGGVTGGASPVLMCKGVERAARSFGQLNDLDSLVPPTLRRESYILGGVLGTWLLSAVLFWGWMFAELPRFLSPFGDHPPYSRTRLLVAPAGAEVDYGKDLTINVATAGPTPKEVTLVVSDPNTGQISRVPMFKSQDGAYFQTIENIRSELVYWAGIERGRSRFYRVTLCKTPRIESVHVRYRYPDYTMLPEKTAVLTADDSVLKGYKGTDVVMTLTSNRPLAGGTATAGGRQYACTGQADGTAQASFPLTDGGEFSISVVDIEGNRCAEPFKGDVELVPDGRPMVAIISPGMNSLAIPTATVPIVIEAQDDLGIQDVSIFRSHNESEDSRRKLFAEARPERYVNVVQTLDLSDLGVRPGDVIDYYATATDSLVSAPQTIASEPFRLQIISEEEYAQMMQTEMTAKDLRLKYENIISQMEQLVRAQEQLERDTAELRESLAQAAAGPLSPENQRKLEELEKRQSELAEQAGTLAHKLEQESRSPPVFDIEKDYKQFLAQFANQTAQAKEHMANSVKELKEGSADGAQCAPRLSMAMAEQKKALEALGAPTEETKQKIRKANQEIERVIKLLADVEMFKTLYLAQKHVTRQTKSYSEVDAQDFETKVRLKELAERETSIEKQLDVLEQDFREHGAEIEQEYPKVAEDAIRIADEIKQREISALMRRGAFALNQGSGIRGYPEVLEALRQMAAMISFCEGTGSSACKNCEFRLVISMGLNPGDTLGQLAAGLGMGMGTGLTGALGRGASGYAGGRSNIAVFGNDTFGQDTMMESSLVAGAKEADAKAISASTERDPLAGNIEELSPQSKRQDQLNVDGDSRMMAEYRPLIEAYFRRLAEEK